MAFAPHLMCHSLPNCLIAVLILTGCDLGFGVQQTVLGTSPTAALEAGGFPWCDGGGQRGVDPGH